MGNTYEIYIEDKGERVLYAKPETLLGAMKAMYEAEEDGWEYIELVYRPG